MNTFTPVKRSPISAIAAKVIGCGDFRLTFPTSMRRWSTLVRADCHEIHEMAFRRARTIREIDQSAPRPKTH
jgi:hypothetical protein